MKMNGPFVIEYLGVDFCQKLGIICFVSKGD